MVYQVSYTLCINKDRKCEGGTVKFKLFNKSRLSYMFLLQAQGRTSVRTHNRNYLLANTKQWCTNLHLLTKVVLKYHSCNDTKVLRTCKLLCSCDMHYLA